MITYLKATLAMLFWALTFVWIKVALETYRPIEIVFLRLVLASLLLFTVMLLSGHWQKINRKDMLHMMLVSLCEPFLYFLGEANGMQHVSATLGSLIISTIPIVTAVGAWLFLREKIYPLLVVGLIVSFSGVAVMSLGTDDLAATTTGILFLLLAVMAGMLYGLLIRSLTLKYSALTIVAWQSFFGLIYFVPVFFINDWSHFINLQHSTRGLTTIAGMSIFASVGAFLLYTGVIRELGVIRANIFTNLIPVFTVILAFLILGDRLNTQSSIGLALTLTGLVISQYRDLQRLRRRF
ncbi:MAG: DMT family transporter [Candidatus Cloacimonadaceae bacterium]|nr:DMT family transporter [Candidatus Cloacimonadaceae bacterium]MDP3113331.1 DMT family transporter [Candidatus Cloacimonadaceae bacterium]